MRILIRILLGLAALTLILVLLVYFSFIAPREAHQRVLNRIDVVIWKNRNSVPPGLSALVWERYLSAPNNALGNVFVAPRYFPTAKLEELAVRIEATWPQGLKTSRDVLAMVEMMSAANPSGADYGPFQRVREWIKEEESAAPAPTKH